jgi:hypothetical protein
MSVILYTQVVRVQTGQKKSERPHPIKVGMMAHVSSQLWGET